MDLVLGVTRSAEADDWTVDVSALIPGEIHMLTIEATGSAAVILTGIDYTNVCLGYTP